MVYVCYEYEGELKEEFLFSVALPQRTTGLEISNTIIVNYIENNGFVIKNCVRACSDGAATLTEEKSGVIKQMKDFAPECVSTHCFLHRKSLATKKLSSKLNNVLREVVILKEICFPKSPSYSGHSPSFFCYAAP